MALYRDQGPGDEVRAFVAALREGCAFPTNLDAHEPQAGSMAPRSEQDITWDVPKNAATKEMCFVGRRCLRWADMRPRPQRKLVELLVTLNGKNDEKTGKRLTPRGHPWLRALKSLAKVPEGSEVPGDSAHGAGQFA